MTTEERYEAVCSEWTVDQADVDLWLGLLAVLGSRGMFWHFQVSRTTEGVAPTWSFGLMRASLLVVEVQRGLVRLYDHICDTDYEFEDLMSLEAWLDEHEWKYEHLPVSTQEMFVHVRGQEPETYGRVNPFDFETYSHVDGLADRFRFTP